MAKVLAAKHTASLQLLCTVGGNQARLDVRTEFKILEPSLKGGVEAGRAPSCIFVGSNLQASVQRHLYEPVTLNVLNIARYSLIDKSR